MRELVSVIMTTYNRTEIARQTLRYLRQNLQYENLAWIIADDGSAEGHIEALLSELDGLPVQVTNAQRKGVGKSKNLALELAFKSSPLILLLEDDWLLSEPFNLNVYADTLVSQPTVGMIRFGYLSTELTADFVGYNDMSYWRIRQGSGVYCYSGQISLRHKRWYDKVGYHKEGVTPGEEELEMCIRYNATPDAPYILWPGNVHPHFGCSIFKNIGMGQSLNNILPEN